MGSAEARARWLRYARACIIQEDYDGASIPARLPPSSSKPESEGSPGDRVSPYDSSADGKWWLHQQPKDNAISFWDTSWETLEKEYAKIQELETVRRDALQKKPMVGDVSSEDDDHLLIFDKPEKHFSEMESEWRIKKTEPWWRTADLNDLASFVSHKSLEHFDNCDLPQPQTNKTDRWSIPDKGLASLGSNKPSRGITSNEVQNLHTLSSEVSTAQLLQALCHSQTRAREAEKAAQQAYNEKEHLITLFLRQASQLYAYKQWLHMLKLETSRNNIYTRFPDFMPWVPIKGKQQKRVRRKGAKRKPGSGTPRYKISKSFWRFLLGLTLAGAGLLLGWTLGWLFR